MLGVSKLVAFRVSRLRDRVADKDIGSNKTLPVSPEGCIAGRNCDLRNDVAKPHAVSGGKQTLLGVEEGTTVRRLGNNEAMAGRLVQLSAKQHVEMVSKPASEHDRPVCHT